MTSASTGTPRAGSAKSATATQTVRVATRGSAQARAQTEAIAELLRAAHPDLEVEFVLVETTGDQQRDVPLHQIGGQGVFVKEVQHAVLEGRADIAVHSAKDLPAAPTEGLIIGAFGERRDPRDALIGARLDELSIGARVASGSVRRRAQLAERRGDLEFVELRGNITTRLSRIPEGGAIVMAVAALEILGMTDQIAEILDPAWMVPMIGQGAVAIECRSDDRSIIEVLAAIDHVPTRAAVEIERAWLSAVGAGCTAPVGAHFVDGELHTFIDGPAGIVRNYRPTGIDDAFAAGRADVSASGL
jgi:hydroxymethylbilane synthase